MNNMFCSYRNSKYIAKIRNNKVLITTKIKQDGFKNYIDVSGKEHCDLFMKEVAFSEVEAVYKENIEIMFKGIYFELFSSGISQANVEDDRFVLFTSSEELAHEYSFEKKEQFVFTKNISKAQIEMIRITQKPIKEFESYGIKEIIIKKNGIDEWLSQLDKAFREEVEIRMTINQLKNKLEELGIPEDLYSIMVGGLPNERLCIIKDEMWQVYYSERGKRTGLRTFETEEEACEYFYVKCKNMVQR